MDEHDWQQVVDKKPLGYAELNDSNMAVYGPVASIEIDKDIDFVHINVKWAIKRPLGQHGIPTGKGKWIVVSNTPICIAQFPNFVVPYVFENTPEKGPRVRFSLGSIIYLNDVQKVRPEEVEGLHPTPPPAVDVPPTPK
jgi:hypothetical protein